MIISFAKTTPALLSGNKTVTRRIWSDRQIALAERNIGKVVKAYDKSPRFGGKHVANIRLKGVQRLDDWFTRPYMVPRSLQPQPDFVVTEYCAEGFHMMPVADVDAILDEWRNNPSPCVRVEFDVVEVLST